MKINNSAELTELLQQAILIMINRYGAIITVSEEVSFSDFERETKKCSEDLWKSYEAGTLDISDPYSNMETFLFSLEHFLGPEKAAPIEP